MIGWLALVLAAPAAALQEPLEEIYGFLAGNYWMIGKAYESNRTYQGEASFEPLPDGEGLRVTRRIDGREVIGEARVHRSSFVESRVLRIRHQEEGVEFEATCLFHSDLDNYARITCHRYRPGIATDAPGLEAYFIRPEPDSMDLEPKKSIDN